MNILIIGSGAREHAMAIALHRSPQHPHIFCCGKTLNPGIKQMTHQYWVGDNTNITEVVAKAKEWGIGLAIVGPEAPLEKGLADALWGAAIPTIGPRKALAQLETNKGFARDLMKKYNIPGLPEYQIFNDIDGVAAFLEELGNEGYVMKANGLVKSTNVKVGGEHLHSMDEALAYCKEILAQNQTVLVEQKFIGQEFSLMAFCDGEHIVHMPIVQDHKRAYVDDKGPNTGGMGSYSDASHGLPFLTAEDVNAARHINEAAYRAVMREVNEKYIGILYGSFIATREGVSVIEFNARFGDPEALNVLTILESDLVAIFQAMVTGNLTEDMVIFARQSTVCKYAVPKGYPDHPVKDVQIDIAAVKNKSRLYFSGIDAVEGKMYARGSRAAAYVGVADSISSAEEISEREIRGIGGPLFHRDDIGTDRLIQRHIDALRKLRTV